MARAESTASPIVRETSTPPIVVHFRDGRVEKGLLCSSLLTGASLLYLPNAPTTGERRREARVPLFTEVTIENLGVRLGVDVSPHGMYVETLTPYPIGAILHVDIRFGRKTISLDAKTVFTDPGIGMGLEFDRLSSTTRHELEALVHHASTSQARGVPRGRRASADRRRRPLAAVETMRWNSRSSERRGSRTTTMTATSPVDIAFSTLKSIFFVNPNDTTGLPDPPPASMDRYAVVEFRDGEEIEGTLRDLSPEPAGLFIDLHLNERTFHPVYVIKSAVKRIRHGG